jgi:hypothetical protein
MKQSNSTLYSILNTIKDAALVVATFGALGLLIQWSWNQFFPLFGLPELNILQAIALFILVFLTISLVSIAWNYHVKQHYLWFNWQEKSQGQNKKINDPEEPFNE